MNLMHLFIKRTKNNEINLFPYNSSSDFFDERISSVFPSQRGLKWFDRKESIYRLNLFLANPLVFKYDTGKIAPIWWFRGICSNSIEKYTKQNRCVYLMNNDELKIKRIAVYKSNIYYRSFIYVETEKMKQSGVYNLNSEEIDWMINEFGYAWEEYAIIQCNRKIKRNDFDDGSTIIRGKVIPIKKKKLKIRYLSDYNFFIVPNDSPINKNIFNLTHNQYSNDLIQEKNMEKKKRIMDDYIKTIEILPKKGD